MIIPNSLFLKASELFPAKSHHDVFDMLHPLNDSVAS